MYLRIISIKLVDLNRNYRIPSHEYLHSNLTQLGTVILPYLTVTAIRLFKKLKMIVFILFFNIDFMILPPVVFPQVKFVCYFYVCWICWNMLEMFWKKKTNHRDSKKFDLSFVSVHLCILFFWYFPNFRVFGKSSTLTYMFLNIIFLLHTWITASLGWK